jgi:exonuclease VII small subunit
MDTRLQRIDELERENAALKEVNDILRKAVAYYARSLGELANTKCRESLLQTEVPTAADGSDSPIGLQRPQDR